MSSIVFPNIVEDVFVIGGGTTLRRIRLFLEGTLFRKAVVAGVLLGGGLYFLEEDECAGIGGFGEGEGMEAGEAAAEVLDGVAGLLDFLPGGGTFVGDDAAADAGEREQVFDERGQGGDGACGDEFVELAMIGRLAGVLGAGVDEGDVFHAQRVANMRHELDFFLGGFDEAEAEMGPHDFQRKAGEAGAGADVGGAHGLLQDGGERFFVDLHERGEQGEGVEEMAGLDVLGIGDGGEVEALVPVEQLFCVEIESGDLLGGKGDTHGGGAGEEGVHHRDVRGER